MDFHKVEDNEGQKQHNIIHRKDVFEPAYEQPQNQHYTRLQNVIQEGEETWKKNKRKILIIPIKY